MPKDYYSSERLVGTIYTTDDPPKEIKMPKTSYTEAELRDFIKDQLYRFIPDIAHDTQEVKDAVDSVSREIMFAVRYYASSEMHNE